MLSVDQALECILNNVSCLEEIECSLPDSLGQTAAEDILAEINVPGWDSAARDGFAVQAADTKSAGPERPVILKVIDRVSAGSAAKQGVTAGAAVRIMTGAPIPPGADCVAQFEDTDEDIRRQDKTGKSRREIGIFVAGSDGLNINRAGDMLHKGALILKKGTPIGPGDLGVLASAGRTGLRVIRRPVAAIIASGEELVEPGKPLLNAQIYSSGTLAIAAQVKRSGGNPVILPIARDNRRSLFSRIRRGVKADLIITCGGSSAGDFDLVNEAMTKLGKVVFRRVNMAPGRPFSFGLIRKNSQQDDAKYVPHFALAGNPPGGMINFEVLVRPAILKMQGRAGIYPETVEAVLLESFENKKEARCFAWAQINRTDNGYFARISRTPEKGIFPSIAASNGLVVIPEDRARINIGDRVPAILLDWI